jgi:NAD(P)-dependent dehydrogenase (short-subunit alcohol dehydrogenase family)
MNVLITGGASGLGQAITRKLAVEPQIKRIYFTYNHSADNARRLEVEFNNTTGIKCDFVNPGHVEKLVSQIPEMDLDVLINNAVVGITNKHFQKTDYTTFERGFQNNIVPAIRITQEAIKSFRKKKFGKIINILTSSLINKPPVGWSEYVAKKAYLLSLSKSWAVENADFNISSNCVSPSFMQTRLTSSMDERIVEQLAKAHPLKRLLRPEEAAEGVLFFINSPQHINGVNLVINAAQDIG